MTTQVIDQVIEQANGSKISRIKRIAARAARNHFADLIGQVYSSGDVVIIERLGKPMVAMVPIALYERLLAPALDSAALGSLFGAFPELAALEEGDFDEAKGLWAMGMEKQLQNLQETE